MRFLFFLLTLSLACQAQYTSRVSAAPSQTDLPAVASWVALFEANRQTAVADGTAISTLSDSSGNARDATQTGSARPVYKIAANGINSQPVIRFAAASSQFMATSAGGASLTGDFYMCALVKFASVADFQHVLCFGQDTADGKRRGMLKYDSAKPGWNGANRDITPGGPALSIGAAYFIEIIRSGTTVSVYLNGTRTSTGNPSLVAYTGGVLNIGTNNTQASEFLNGDLALAGFIGSAPTTITLGSIRGYMRDLYGIAFPVGAANEFLARYSQTGAVSAAGFFDAGSTVGHAGVFDRALVAFCKGRSTNGQLIGHWLGCDDGLIGPLVIQNLNTAGYSAPDFWDATVGMYNGSTLISPFGSAAGWGNVGCTPAVFDGVGYFECYDSNAGGTHRSFRLVQTAGNTNYRRFQVDGSTGDITFYRRDNGYPTESEIMRIKNNGHINFSNVPTSSSGLSSGDIYSNLGVLTIVP